MGSYLSAPVTEKNSFDQENDKLKCGSSSMQGWRISQEDAHNCILNYDANTSFFSVYDGHGGHEVAVYCSQNLPEYIRDTEAYKQGNYEQALIDGFLGFDASMETFEVIQDLKMLADERNAVVEEEEENVSHLYEEATMPIEQVIEKYKANYYNNPKAKHWKSSSSSESGSTTPMSPYLKAKSDTSSLSTSVRCHASSSSTSETSSVCDEDAVSSSNNSNEASSTISNSKPDSPNTSVVVSTSESVSSATHGKNEECAGDLPDSSNGSAEVTLKPDQSELCEDTNKSKKEKEAEEVPTQNGEIVPVKSKDEEEQSQKISSSTPQENGELSKKGKGKALTKTKGVTTLPAHTRPRRSATQLYNKLLIESESESEDEEDKTFEGPNEDSSGDDGDEEEVLNCTIEEEEEVSGSSCCDEEDEEEDDDEPEELELDEFDKQAFEFAKSMRDEPGCDSGCTAVVALLKENELYVANAGDSRCVVCRNGKAIEMSIDHKPEDNNERRRVENAGGRVTIDGRVNGGLNLSRALGDHAYKMNKKLPPQEQMITALPDVRTLTINPAEDEFMVLACDGIWNSMSSQEVVDFVKMRLDHNVDKLSQICEEIFDSCLAPNTLGDGTGCDNMTAIIVQFKPNIAKRSASDDSCDESAKRLKTEQPPAATEDAPAPSESTEATAAAASSEVEETNPSA